MKLVARICVVNENHASLRKYSPNAPVRVDVRSEECEYASSRELSRWIELYNNYVFSVQRNNYYNVSQNAEYTGTLLCM